MVSSRATIGRIAINNIEISTNQGFKNIIIKDKTKVYHKYLAYAMTRLRSQMESLAIGGTFKEISKSNFMTLKIPLPTLEEQRVIVAEIESYQRIIDAARTIINNYRPLININPSWQRVELGKIGTVTSSKRIFQNEYVDNGIPFYRTKEIVELSKGKDISLELYISQNKYNEIKSSYDIPKKGDILISAVGTIGVSWIVPNDNPFYFKDGNLIWIKDITNASPLYIKTVLDSIVATNIDSITNGAAYNALTIVNLKKVLIPLPAPNIQQQIVAEIEREQAAVNNAKELIEIFTKKITNRIAQIWNE